MPEFKKAKTLYLGSAQFSGKKYGIGAKHSLSYSEVKSIIRASFPLATGIDTAHGYGSSELWISQALKELGIKLNISTKLKKMQEGVGALATLKALEESLDLFEGCYIKGIYFHGLDDLFTPQADYVLNVLSQMRRDSMIERIGISVYTPAELTEALNRFDFNLVQAPLNLMDTRILTHKAILNSSTRKIELHARSIFLQGVLSDIKVKIPSRVSAIQITRRMLSDLANENGILLSDLALAFVNQIRRVDALVVGVDSARQVSDFANIKHISSGLIQAISEIETDPLLVDPRYWFKY